MKQGVKIDAYQLWFVLVMATILLRDAVLQAALPGSPTTLKRRCAEVGLDCNSEITLGAAIDFLEEKRGSSANSGIDAVLVPLTDYYLHSATPMEAPNALSPRAWDVVITDIHEPDLEIYNEFGMVRGQPIQHERSFSTPATGVFFGASNRLMLPLTVANSKVTINVVFLVDTGAPATYLRSQTLTALGYTESTPSSAPVRINGLANRVYVSHTHFHNVDVLGQDYLRALGGVLNVDYRRQIVTLLGPS